MATNAAMIGGTGRGHQVGGPLPKQYRQLAGSTVLGHSVRQFATHPHVASVHVVIDPAEGPFYEDAVQGDVGAEATALMTPVAGGATRQHSVRNGPESLEDASPTSS